MAKSDVLVRMKADTTGYDANIAKARRQLDGFKKDNLSMGGVMKQLSGSLISAAGSFASVTAAVGALSSAIMGNIETARNFEKSMSQLSSLTGMTGKDLNQLKEYAIELGSTTTLSASQVADAFKMIGSQQPQLLASGEALKEVTKYAITLSEAAGIDLQVAAQTLSTSINQMGGDSSNAARYVNVLAAASQKGAGDIAWLGEALTKSATAAKAVGTDYEELVANLEQLAKAGFDASTAGTALRSIIMNLEKQANSQFKPSIVGLTQAFENLGKANLSITQYQELTGKMFATQAMALAEAAGEAKNMTAAITGTNTAEEQAMTNTDNLDGSLKSLASAWEGLNLHINSSNGILRSCVEWLKNVVVWADKTLTVLGRVQARYNEMNGGGGGSPSKVDQQLSALRGSNYKNYRYNRAVEVYNNQIKSLEAQIKVLEDKFGGTAMDAREDLGALVKMRDEYMSRAKEILSAKKVVKDAVSGGSSGGSSGGGGGTGRVPKARAVRSTGKAAEVFPAGSIAAMNQELKHYQELQQRATDTSGWMEQQARIDELTTKIKILKGEIADPGKVQNKKGMSVLDIGTGKDRLAEVQQQLNDILPEDGVKIPATLDIKTDVGNGLVKQGKDVTGAWKEAASAIGTVGSALSSIDDPAAKVMGTIAQAIASVALAAAQAVAAKDTTASGYAWIGAAAAITATMITMISQIHQATGYAQGGVVDGSSYSGDNIPIMANAGEVVLTKAQTASLASQLQEGNNGVRVSGEIHGETIVLAANRYLRRSGRGELVTWK